MTTRWARFARGWVAAGFATFMAAFFHVAAGGTVPGVVPAAVSLAFSAMLCIALAGKTLSLTRQAISVGASQFLFHILFSLGDPVIALAGSTRAHAGMAMTAEAGSGMRMSMFHDPWMWAGHASAAVLTVAMLRYGEGAFWHIRGLARMVIRSFLPDGEAPIVPETPRFRVSRNAAALPHELRMLADIIVHRGPPRALAL